MISILPNRDSKLDEFAKFKDVDFIVTDLDGTLIKGAEPLVNQIKIAISSIQKKKTRFTVATGRTFYGARSLLDEIGLKFKIPVALYNGCVVLEYGTNEIIRADGISLDAMKALWKLNEKFSVDMFFYSLSYCRNSLSEKTDIFEKVYVTDNCSTGKDTNGMDVFPVKNMDDINGNIISVLIDYKKMSEELRLTIRERIELRTDISYTDSGNGFFEIKNAKLDKGTICDILRMRKPKWDTRERKILAIGDNDNDIELFQKADISVAVENASEQAINYAEYVCENESASGFLDLLKVLERVDRYFG